MLRPRAAPPGSGAEMDALAATGRVTSVTVDGALAPHEEEPDAIAAAILRLASRGRVLDRPRRHPSREFSHARASPRCHGPRQSLPAAALQTLGPQVHGDVHAERGAIDFGDGRSCTLTATAATLLVAATVPEGSDLDRMQTVIADHIRRFAFKEELTFAWQRLDA